MRYMLTLGALALLSTALAAAPRYGVQADIVRGAPGAQGAVCVANSVFFPGENIVWRVKVFDNLNGKALTQAQVKALGVTVTIKLDNGVSKELLFSSHPPNGKATEWFYAGSWQTTAQTPTGTLKWSAVVRDKAGRTVTYTPIGQDVGLAALTIAPKATPKQ